MCRKCGVIMEFRFNDISERDMDMLFLEEFAVNKEFLCLFTKKINTIDLSDYVIVSEEVSYVDAALGESDLTIVLEHDGHRVALLIEDKINAIAQPRQYERYIMRGEKGVGQKLYDAFYVFLVAPAAYIECNDSAEKYPLKVSYEECRDLFARCSDTRSSLKYQQIAKAIEQGHRPYTKVVDEVSTTFWDSYVQHMQTYYPDIALRSKVKEKSKNGDWPTYRTGLDMREVYIHHKMKMKNVGYSYIDLTFNGTAEHREELKALLKEMLGVHYDASFGIHKAGKSAVLRVVVPKCLDWQMPYEEQIDTVDEHLRSVARLCEVARMIEKDRLMEFYAKIKSEKVE